ncbi:hypothetical protein DH2020_018181 [Rehmannia glutinosa]|uniref:Reverse transcriptase domain-containing protein n=1 Tax=Rehmannia glutinosa TaxID=99300 RepID=A0ABR0WLM8_REHGL
MGYSATPPGPFLGFRASIDDCGLIDLGMIGYPFTWEIGRGTVNWVEERLDRCLATQSWYNLFPNCKVWNLEASMSDHSPIFLELGLQFRIKRVKRFRFENSWLREGECRNIVSNGWNKGVTESLQGKIATCGEELFKWGEMLKNSFNQRIKEARRRMNLFRSGRDEYSIGEFKKAQREYNLLLAQREDFWKQRAKLFWLKGGDANTRYFHTVASTRKRHNTITRLKNQAGTWITWDSGLGSHMVNYFVDIYSSTRCDLDPILQCVEQKVSLQQNEALQEPFTELEIKEALFAMFPDKSPGPDGMNPAFFQKFWDITGRDLVSSCLRFMNSCAFPEGFNDTMLVLIPKKNSPEYITDLRPIALCNVAYKVVSKVLANRLKAILPNIISETQSAFVPRRLISDNIMVAFEINHFLKRKRQGNEGWQLVRLT